MIQKYKKKKNKNSHENSLVIFEENGLAGMTLGVQLICDDSYLNVNVIHRDPANLFEHQGLGGTRFQ